MHLLKEQLNNFIYLEKVFGYLKFDIFYNGSFY